jgi:hypothetical protein
MKKKYLLQKNEDSVLILYDGKSIEDIGYIRNINLENKDSLRYIIGNNKTLLLVNYERNNLEQIEIHFQDEWESKYENNISFLEEDSPRNYKNGYVYFVEVYENISNDLIVVFYYNH